jgi:hypothetical protein
MYNAFPASPGVARATLQALGTAAVLLAAPSLAMDIAPGDYAVPPPDSTLALYYGQFSSSRALRVDDSGTMDDSSLDLQVNLLRVARYGKVGELPFAVQAIVPFGRFDEATVGGIEQKTAEGLGDVILGASIFPVQSNGTTIGLSAFLALPTGEYASDAFSVGSGTTSATVQLGLLQPLTARVTLDAAVDVSVAAAHTHAGVEYSQDPQAQAQAYLRFALGQQTNVSFGYAGTFGGKQFADDVYRGLSAETHQLRVFADTFITPTLHVQAMLGRDVSRPAGFETDVVGQLRLLKIF